MPPSSDSRRLSPVLAALLVLNGAAEPLLSAGPPEEGPAKRPSGVSAAVSRVTALAGNNASAEERLEALRRLSPRLSPADKEALLSFAFQPRPPGFPPVLWHALFNDTLDVLLKCQSPPPGLDRELIRAARENPDSVLRDYALQKLGTLTAPTRPEAVRREALEALKEGAAHHGANFQGTALLAWRRAVPPEGDPELEKAVLACLSSPDSTGPARTAALQTGASLKMTATATAARLLLRDPVSPVPLKMSALAALGAAGEKADISLISSFTSDPACRAAAEAALEKLSKS